MRIAVAAFLVLLCAFSLQAAPTITVSASSVSILGTSQIISLTCTLIDPNSTGNLTNGAGGVITVFTTSTVTPGTTATCGPIYANSVILDGYGNANTTYYRVQVFTVSGGIVASTPSLQQFYAFTGSGTIDLATATPLAPSFFTGPGGSVSIPGTFTTGNINAVQWAGPGATPTIDQAVTACGANPCTVYISSSYSGAESASLTTTSFGYNVYAGLNNVTVVDLRANAATPGNPGAAPLYPIVWGGRMGGALNRLGTNYWSSSPPDSTAAINAFNWVTGTMPSNGGGQIGIAGVAVSHDAITHGISTAGLAGIDGEAIPSGTSGDSGTHPLNNAYGGTFGAHITRTGVTEIVQEGGAIHAFGCGNVSVSGGGFNNCYAIKADPPGVVLGSGEAFSLYTLGDTLAANNTNWWAHNFAGVAKKIVQFTTGDFVVFTPLNDANGIKFDNQAGGDNLIITSASIQAKEALLGTSVLGCITPGQCGAGAAGTELGSLYLLEGSAPTGRASDTVCGAVSSIHMLECSYNNGTALPVPQTNNVGGTHSDSGLYQTKRAVAGCTTGAAAGGSCGTDITVTWGTAFADANYSVTCTGSTPTNAPSAPFVVSGTKLAATVHINYFAITAAAASYSTIDCIAVHD